ncbi:sulfatase-like hydrolase/transferase [Kiritimatiella glycovorans]|nr:sulfatase-like hydrolase/transferase [Kiritimatiella glycovorans]
MKKRPNLLFVFADQHSYDILGCNGCEQVKTPRFDAFSREGLSLDSCFSISPLCTPMRGALLSGQHPLHNGAFDNCVQMRPGNGDYFAEVLKRRGYTTAYVGKWHLYGGYWYQPVPAGPFRYGFDDLFLTNNCDLNYTPGNAFYFHPESGERIKFGEWEPFGQTGQALDFLDRVKADEPWTLFVSWHPPHNHRTRSPDHDYAYSAPREYLDRYEYEAVRVREGTPDTEENRRMMHGYMALVSSIDDCFGMLMDKLRERGMDEDTIVVYTADHGDMLKKQDGRYFIKSHAESQSSQVPFMIRWPGRFRPGERTDLPFGTLDIMPTLLSLMGVSPPPSCHGRDLSQALLRGGDGDDRASVPMFMCSCTEWRGAATRDWIYSYDPRYRGPGGWPHDTNALYDRRRDPQCLNNLYGMPGYRETQERMHRITQDWMAHFDDPFMPYVELRDAVIDPADRNGKPYIDFWDPEAEGVPETRPIEAARAWARAQT